MTYLLDTHFLVWILIDDSHISKAARTILTDPRNRLIFSVASIWELSIKHARRPKFIPIDPSVIRRKLLEDGYIELPISGEHVLAAGALPPIHKDPFDRLLIAQSTIEGIVLLTADKGIATYPGLIRKV
ncbi:MAG TPA: type II toxin-antitoxin system VapC family toxin [Terracidiphilus sp.]